MIVGAGSLMLLGFAGCIQGEEPTQAPTAKEGRDYDSATCAIPGWVVNEKDESYTGEVWLFGGYPQRQKGTDKDGKFLITFVKPGQYEVGLSDYKGSYEDVRCVSGKATEPVKILVDCQRPHTVCH